MPMLPAVASAAIPVEWLGWAAAGLTLATFICRDMRRLRLLALAANAAFIAYGAVAQLLPVLMLHLALVPVNLWRLNEAFRGKPHPPASPGRGAFALGAPGTALRRRRPRSWRANFRAAQAIATDAQPAPDAMSPMAAHAAHAARAVPSAARHDSRCCTQRRVHPDQGLLVRG